MKKKIIRFSLALGVVVLAYGAWLLWCSSQNLVTLDVRDMDVREVVKKIERQTWETILADSNVTGKVTIKVKRAHLETVLDIITDQISARWSSLYPLYSSGQTLVAFKKSVRGEIDPAANGWTNLQSRGNFGGGPGFGGRGGGPGGGGPGGGGPGGVALGDPKDPSFRITLDISGKDVQFATLALSRYAQLRVVPEDGTTGLVSLPLEKAKISDAMGRFAKQVHRKWARIYSLQGFPDFGRGGDIARNGRPDRNEDGGRRFDWMNMTDEERDQRRQERENVEKELTQVLPAEQQAKLAEDKAKRDQLRAEMANMTDEQRRERFQQLAASGQGGGRGGGGRDTRMLDRIKNTTPEQKVDRYRTAIERRQRWESRGGGQGGGPGRGR